MTAKSKKKWIIIGIFILTIVAIACTYFFYKMSTQTKLHSDTVVGNTAGNLYNSGTFCEIDETVYFANNKDQMNLYSMSIDETNFKKMCGDSVTSINADKDYIYYVRNNLAGNKAASYLRTTLFGVYRMNRNGKNQLKITNDKTGVLSLAGNFLYFQHYDTETALTLYRGKTDGTDIKMVLREAVIPMYAGDLNVYYSGLASDHNVTGVQLGTSEGKTIYEGNCYMPIKEGNTLYFLDLDHNYALAKVNLETKQKTLLTRDRVDTYNMYGDYIFYQSNDEGDQTTSGLYRMKTDGSNPELIRSGVHNNINVTSKNVYFNPFESKNIILKTSVSGTINVVEFEPEKKE